MVTRSPPGNLGRDSQTRTQWTGTPAPVEEFERCLDSMCTEIKLMVQWMEQNPNSRSGLLKYVQEAGKALEDLEKVRNEVAVNDKGKVKKLEIRNENSREEIREIIQEISNGEMSRFDKLMKMRWPETAYERASLDTEYPLKGGKKRNLALVFSKKGEENSALAEMAIKAYGEMNELLMEGKVTGGYQTIEMVRKKGLKDPETTYGFLLEMDDQGDNMRKLVSDLKVKKCKDIGIVTASKCDPETSRKLAEISFFETGIEVTVFHKAKTTQNDKPKVRDYDTLKIKTMANGAESYAEMAGKIKENLDPIGLGVTIKGSKKTGKNEITIHTEKGGADKVKKQLTEKINQESGCQMTVESIVHNRPILITNIEALATEEDLKKAIQKALGNTKMTIEIKKLYDTKFGDKNAEIWLEEEHANALEEMGKLTVVWCVCFIKKKLKIDRCTRCLKIGHRTAVCRSKEQMERCLNCCKEGHKYSTCTSKAFCNECNVEGHCPVTTRCPAFRRRVNKKAQTSK